VRNIGIQGESEVRTCMTCQRYTFHTVTYNTDDDNDDDDDDDDDDDQNKNDNNTCIENVPVYACRAVNMRKPHLII